MKNKTMNKYVNHYDKVCSVCDKKCGNHCNEFDCDVVDALEACSHRDIYEIRVHNHPNIHIGRMYSPTMFAQDNISTPKHKQNDCRTNLNEKIKQNEWLSYNAKRTYLAVCEAKKIIKSRTEKLEV
jgi:hypothetical protein